MNGIRKEHASLPVDHPNYIGIYGGNPLQRDSAYHQGTVWSWLLGPYIDAIMKINEADGLNQARQIINRFKYHLSEGCIGSISEIFDGDAPHHPRGCIAQAWGVAELLRVMKEYELYGSADCGRSDRDCEDTITGMKDLS